MNNIFSIKSNEDFIRDFADLKSKYTQVIDDINDKIELFNILGKKSNNFVCLLLDDDTSSDLSLEIKKMYFNSEKKAFTAELIRSYFHSFNNSFSVILGYLDYANFLEDLTEIKKSVQISKKSLDREIANTFMLHKFIKNSFMENMIFSPEDLINDVFTILKLYVIEKEYNLKFSSNKYFEINSNYSLFQYFIYRIFEMILKIIIEDSELTVNLDEKNDGGVLRLFFNCLIMENNSVIIKNMIDLQNIEKELRTFAIGFYKLFLAAELLGGNFDINLNGENSKAELSFSKNLLV